MLSSMTVHVLPTCCPFQDNEKSYSRVIKCDVTASAGTRSSHQIECTAVCNFFFEEGCLRFKAGFFLFAIGSIAIYPNLPLVFASTDMRRLTTGMLSEKRVIRRICRCANVIECTDTKPDSTTY